VFVFISIMKGDAMPKKIHIKKTVYENFNNDPEGLYIMETLGFSDIVKPKMLSSVGRVMTIRQGALLQNIDIEVIKRVFKEYNYIVEE